MAVYCFLRLNVYMAEAHPIYELTNGKEVSISGNIAEIVINHFGLNKNLLDQISRLSKSVSPLSRMVFSNDAVDTILDQVHKGEGRGTYHRDGDGNVIYVKGTGNRSLLEDQNNGFPGKTSSLLHKFSPRAMGASDMVENVIEYVNAYIVFAGVAQERGWVELNNAVEAGVTVPLNLVEFDELSTRTAELWNESKERKGKYPSVGWNSLGGIGTISMLVPSDERVSNHIFNNFVEREPIDSQLLNPEYVAPVCRSIRELLKMGMIYYYDGFHAQNFF